MSKSSNIVPLSQRTNGQDADCFVILAEKEQLKTKDGKPYFRVIFSDASRSVTCPIWSDSPHFLACRDEWKVGAYYKVRAVYRDSGFGPKLEISRIREVVDADKMDGFSPNDCRPSSSFEPDIMYEELLTLAKNHIGKGTLLQLIQRIFKEYRPAILETPASRSHHHPYLGGLLEHTLSVTKIAFFLASHHQKFYSKYKSQLSIPLVVAGAILHDMGKIFEMEFDVIVPRHTLTGELVGHPVLGRDLVRKFAPEVQLDENVQLRLEHIILSHPRFEEWGSVKTPMTLEAIIVHEADYADAIFGSTIRTLEIDDSKNLFTQKKGPLGSAILREP